jgi:hypothetical protein
MAANLCVLSNSAVKKDLELGIEDERWLGSVPSRAVSPANPAAEADNDEDEADEEVDAEHDEGALGLIAVSSLEGMGFAV